MKILDRVLRFLGYKRAPTYAFEIDEGVLPKLEEIASQQEREVDEIAAALLDQAVERYVMDRDKLRRWGTLTERERQVAAFTCLGYTNAEIAERLSITVKTVKAHLGNVFKKLGVDSRGKLQVLYDWDFGEWEL